MNSMTYRKAEIQDIPQIQRVRNSVRENRLSDPSLVTDENVEEFITLRGQGWVCVIGTEITGFAIIDLKEHNVWALFVHPIYEGTGIGKNLLGLMLDWYFEHTSDIVWLGTAPATRAERFYRMQGWKEAGKHGKGEIRFEIDLPAWSQLKALR